MLLPIECPPLHTGVILPELFDKTFLPVRMPPSETEEHLPVSYIIDRLAGVIKIPFLIWEAQRIQSLIGRKNLGEFEFIGVRTLSLTSNYLEFFCWLGERGYIELSLGFFTTFRTVYYLAKTILYSYAIFIDSQMLHQCEESSAKKGKTYVQLLLFSHLTYLSCMLMGGVSLLLGTHFSRSLIRAIHFSSLAFDIASKPFERAWSQVKDMTATPISPKQNLYL